VRLGSGTIDSDAAEAMARAAQLMRICFLLTNSSMP
jgi:hypothetical protein